MRKHLLNYDIQYFADEVEGAEVQETADPVEEETSEAEVETGETEETEAPQPQQSDEDNARYAAIRRRAEEDARRKYQGQMEALNQRAAALCQGIPNPATNQPIRTMEEYLDALQYQQRQAAEVEMQEKGIDPSMIDRMIATNPVVMQAQQVLEATQMNDANMRLQNDIAEICKVWKILLLCRISRICLTWFRKAAVKCPYWTLTKCMALTPICSTRPTQADNRLSTRCVANRTYLHRARA